MSTGPIVNSNASVIPEPTSTIGADVTNTVRDNAPKQTNGDSHPPKSGDVSQIPGERKSADASGSVDAAKPAEKPQPGGTVLATDVNSAGETKPDAPNTGVKRELESSSAPTDTVRPVVESSDPPADAPTAKKQKTDDNTTAGNGTQADGDRKKTRRPKKVKEAVKKVIPTDGIGSRTRSRTKAVS